MQNSISEQFSAAKRSKTGQLKQGKAGTDVVRPLSSAQPSVSKKQKGESLTPSEEDALRNFDLDTSFGPCIGVTRKERWERASRFNLDPPSNVLSILERMPNNSKHQDSIWQDRV